MKSTLLIVLFLLPLVSWGEELLFLKKKVAIHKWEGMRVNAECVQGPKECLAVLAKAPVKAEEKGPGKTVGHPASKFCAAKGGRSAIFEDQKHNQYDYCIFEKFYVDSWDLYRKYKQ